MSHVAEATDQERDKLYLSELLEEEARQDERLLCRTDLFYLLTVVLHRPDADHPWLKARCKEVQEEPDGVLDLWARDHYKSTIITFALTIQDILSSHGDEPLPKWNGREVTVGILSHTRPISKGFLRQIKYEFETNEDLKYLFPDILWDNPSKDAPKWSEDDGIIVKRKSNPKESTVEAWGMVDAQPTSKHFFLRVYDDIVTRESVSTPEMIAKTNAALELSDNLGTKGGIERYVGTRYHFNDTYKTMLDRGIKTRVHPCTENGEADGEPVLLTRAMIVKKRGIQGAYTFGCQMLLDPVADKVQGFRREWLKYCDQMDSAAGMNVYILVDPANAKKKSSDYTAFCVVGLGADENYYWLDGVRDRLSLTERSNILFMLHQKWRPIGVGYEQYGMMADIAHHESVMKKKNYRFSITPLGGKMPKPDRIKRLIPSYEGGRWYLPRTLFKTDYEGINRDLVTGFVEEEYAPFPVALHDDMFDAMARIMDEDMNASFPLLTPKEPNNPERRERYQRPKRRRGGSPMSR